jgi:hypothetical protein
LFGFHTQGKQNNTNETVLNSFDLYAVSRYGYATRIPNFLHNVGLNVIKTYNAYPTDGLITGYQVTDVRCFITGNITVPVGSTLTISGEVGFANHSTLTCNGTIYMQNSAKLNLGHASNVLISGQSAAFYMKNTTTIRGDVDELYSETPPGYPAGSETPIPGDRIYTEDGGLFTAYNDGLVTSTNQTFTNHTGVYGNRVWEGVYINNPRANANYTFVNATIRDIRYFHMAGTSTPKAKLKLDVPSLTGVQVIVENGHTLAINEGTSDGQVTSNITATTATPIYIVASNFDIRNCTFTKTGNDVSQFDAVYTSYVGSTSNYMLYCHISGFDGDGITNYDNHLYFNNNDVNTNDGYGLLMLGSADFAGSRRSEFNNNNLHDNGKAEYCGYPAPVYRWLGVCPNTIADASSAGGEDAYIIKILGWNSSMPQFHMLATEDPARYYPVGAWVFDRGSFENSNILLDARNAINETNYDYARTLCRTVIDGNYDEVTKVEAADLLFLAECYSERDFGTLRNYLENLNFVDEEYLNSRIRDIYTKSLMQENNYQQALECLEGIILNPYNDDVLANALVDQVYCQYAVGEVSRNSGPVASYSNAASLTRLVDGINRHLNGFEPVVQTYEEQPTVVVVDEDICNISSYPNPFTNSSTIKFDAKNSTNALIEVYNVKGQKVVTICQNYLDKGPHQMTWSGLDSNGKKVSSGVYFYRIQTDHSTKTHKMVVIK